MLWHSVFFLETSMEENDYIKTSSFDALGDKHLDLLVLLVFTSLLPRFLKCHLSAKREPHNHDSK